MKISFPYTMGLAYLALGVICLTIEIERSIVLSISCASLLFALSQVCAAHLSSKHKNASINWRTAWKSQTIAKNEYITELLRSRIHKYTGFSKFVYYVEIACESFAVILMVIGRYIFADFFVANGFESFLSFAAFGLTMISFHISTNDERKRDIDMMYEIANLGTEAQAEILKVSFDKLIEVQTAYDELKSKYEPDHNAEIEVSAKPEQQTENEK